MNELNTQFSDQIDFFYLDIDQPQTDQIMAQLDVRRRSTYILLDADGSELARWVGPLNLASVSTEIELNLAE